MGKDKIESFEDLKELAKRSFHVVEPSVSCKGKGNVRIGVDSYAELGYFLIDMLKVCVAALEAESEGVGTVSNVACAVGGVLEKVIGVVPLEEMGLLDRVREMVAEDGNETR